MFKTPMYVMVCGDPREAAVFGRALKSARHRVKCAAKKIL